MNILQGKLSEKQGFIYRINTSEGKKYFYIGCGIYKECVNDKHIELFNKYASAIEEDNSKNIRIYYNNLLDASKGRSVTNRKFREEINDLMYSLDYEEVKALDNQVNLLSYLYSRYSNRYLSRRYFIE